MTWSDAAREAAAEARRMKQKDNTPGTAATHQNPAKPDWQVKEEQRLAVAQARAQELANKTGQPHVVIKDRMNLGGGRYSNDNHFSALPGGPAYEGTHMGSFFPKGTK